MNARPQRISLAPAASADRIGMAQITRMAFDGVDLRPLWRALMAKIANGTAGAGAGLDLSLVAQLLGDKQTGLAIQSLILAQQRLFRSPCPAIRPKLRVLALAAAIDMGGNTPIEFLLEGSDIELMTLYVVPGTDWYAAVPDHDVAMVIASDSEECRGALAEIAEQTPLWPRPMLNMPQAVANLDRDKLWRLLADVDGLEIPETIAMSRERLQLMSLNDRARIAPVDEPGFSLIIRPRGSHAGVGLARLDGPADLAHYLGEGEQAEFFVSRFVDYASGDGLYRKYRVVFVDGSPYACHMAIADRWDIWYLNAGMAFSASKRLEEETFFRTFDDGFAGRHRAALAVVAERIGLEYFIIDCAETADGRLLLFEADNTAVVHNMDSPDLYPYKAPQMRKIFDAFVTMLRTRVGQQRSSAA